MNRDTVLKLYLKYVNDYLTVQKFASDHLMNELIAVRVINAGRKLNDRLAK